MQRRAAALLDPALLAGTPALALLVVWVLLDGGYAPTAWYPGGLLIAGLLVAVLIGMGGHLRRPDGPRLVAIGAMAAYTAWSYASITWAGSPGDAFAGANRTLVYLLGFSLLALLPWRAHTLRLALTGLVLALAAVAVVTILRVDAAVDPDRFFVNARLSAPLGYQNASAALWSMVALAAVVLASRPEVAAPARALMAGAVPLFLGMGLMAQSRGWLAALPLAALVVLTLAPRRLVVIAMAVPGIVATVVIAPTLLEVFDSGGSSVSDFRTLDEAVRVIRQAFDEAARALLLAAATATAAAGALVAADRLLDRDLTVPRPRPIVVGLLAALTLAGATTAVVAATEGDPVSRVTRAWEDFKEYDATVSDSANRFNSIASSRYDFWRVAVDVWLDRPLSGIGQDNYLADYLRRGRSSEKPRWTHSLPLRLLAHTGLVGFVLFAAAVVALAAGLLRGFLHGPVERRAVAAASAAPLAVWLIQGAQEWLWEFPALSVMALGLAGAAAAVPASASPPGPASAGFPADAAPVGAARRAVLPLAMAVVVAGVAVATLVAPWLSARLTQRATAAASADPGGALERLDQAASLNPLSADPDTTAGVVALRAGNRAEAVRRFGRVLERDPQSWFAAFETGLLLGRRDPVGARRHLDLARRLSPREPLIRRAIEALRKGQPLSVDAANEELRAGTRRTTER